MPVLNVGVQRRQLDAAAPIAIYATMLFPRDVTLRQQYFAVKAAGGLRSRGSLDKAHPDALAAIHDAALEGTLAKHVAQAERAGFAVGLMLWVYVEHVRHCPKKASLKEVSERTGYFLRQRKGAGGDLPAGLSSNPSKLRERYWGRYNSVAHLWGALHYADSPFGSTAWGDWRTSPRALLHMLALSEKLLSILSVYSPPKQKEPALEASQAWRPPGRDILPLPEVWLLPDLLDWEQLEAEYRSRS